MCVCVHACAVLVAIQHIKFAHIYAGTCATQVGMHHCILSYSVAGVISSIKRFV